MPRPTRRRACLAPSAGCRLLSCNVLIAIPALSLDLGDRYQIIDLANHTPYFGGIGQNATAIDATQTQPTYRITVVLFGANHRAHECDFKLFLCHSLPQNFLNGFTSLGGNLGRSIARSQAIKCSTYEVIRVVRAKALGDHITHPECFENCAHGTTSNYPGTLDSGRDEHFRCSVATNHCMVQSTVF